MTKNTLLCLKNGNQLLIALHNTISQIKLGLQTHDSLQHSTLLLKQKMLSALLDYIEQSNLNSLDSLKNYDAFYFTEEVAIPIDQDGLRSAMVHPEICGKNFEVVNHC